MSSQHTPESRQEHAGSPPEDDFDSAKLIVQRLAGIPTERQLRIMRWVSESLGHALPATPTTPTPMSSRMEEARGDAQPVTTENMPPSRAKDIKTFIEQKQPKSDVQFATAVAYYYRFEAPENDRAAHITAAVLQEATRLVGRSRLSSPRKALTNAKQAGYLNNPALGEYAVNTVGENLVAMGMPMSAAVSDSGAARRRPPRAPKKAKIVRKAK